MKYTAFLVVLTFELQLTVQQWYRTEIHLWNIHELMSLQPHGTCEELFFPPTSLSLTLNNEEQKRYETTCLCVSFEIFSCITLLSVLKSSRYSSSWVYPQQKHPPKQSAGRQSFQFQVQQAKHKTSTPREWWHGWVFGGMCLRRGAKAEFLPKPLVRKLNIYYPSWKTTTVS